MRRYRVTIEGHAYEVEVDDPRARPVIARVAGETFAVDVASDAPALGSSGVSPAAPPAPAVVPAPAPSPSRSSTGGDNVLRAPIPGVVVAVVATQGKAVERGDELVTIEAMKMFNVIRSPRAGTIVEVHVTDRKRVAQGDPLVTFAP